MKTKEQWLKELKAKCPTAHKNKVVADCQNIDGEVYYQCNDCGGGWRQKPETEEDRIVGDRIMDMDLDALGIIKIPRA